MRTRLDPYRQAFSITGCMTRSASSASTPIRRGGRGPAISRELGQLIVRRAKREAVVEHPFAPPDSVSDQPTTSPEGANQQPSRGKSYEHQYDCDEDERRDERRLSRLLVRHERDRGNDGADPPAAGDDRCSVEARVAPRDVDAPRRAGGETARRPIDRCAGGRAREPASSSKDPAGG